MQGFCVTFNKTICPFIYNIMSIMSSPPLWAVFSYHQPHIFELFTMFLAGGYDINPSGIDAAVTEDVGELGDIFFNAVKRAGKQVTKVMRKNFGGVDVCVPAKLFHFSPDVCTADGPARFGDKYRTAVNMVTICIFQKLFLKLTDDYDRSRFSLTAYFGITSLCCINCDELKLADADPRAADRLKNE